MTNALKCIIFLKLQELIPSLIKNRIYQYLKFLSIGKLEY